MSKVPENAQDERRAFNRRMDSDIRDSIQHRMGIRSLDGKDVGTADRVTGEYLRMQGDDGGTHWVPGGLISRVDQYVHLEVSAADLPTAWHDDDPNEHPGRGVGTAINAAGGAPKQREHATHEERNEKQ